VLAVSLQTRGAAWLTPRRLGASVQPRGGWGLLLRGVSGQRSSRQGTGRYRAADGQSFAGTSPAKAFTDRAHIGVRALRPVSRDQGAWRFNSCFETLSMLVKCYSKAYKISASQFPFFLFNPYPNGWFFLFFLFLKHYFSSLAECSVWAFFSFFFFPQCNSSGLSLVSCSRSRLKVAFLPWCSRTVTFSKKHKQISDPNLLFTP